MFCRLCAGRLESAEETPGTRPRDCRGREFWLTSGSSVSQRWISRIPPGPLTSDQAVADSCILPRRGIIPNPVEHNTCENREILYQGFMRSRNLIDKYRSKHDEEGVDWRDRKSVCKYFLWKEIDGIPLKIIKKLIRFLFWIA